MKRLLLVRHGETDWNAAQRLQGQSDMTLNERGRKQGRALAPLIMAIAPDLALASDLKRAAETSALLGRPDAELMPTLREQSLGEWEGRAIAALQDQSPQDYRGWRAGRYAPPGGEAWEVFRRRVAAEVARAAERCRSAAVITCHGGVIRAALDAFIGLPPSRLIPVGPGSLSILAQDGAGFRLEAFNIAPGAEKGHPSERNDADPSRPADMMGLP